MKKTIMIVAVIIAVCTVLFCACGKKDDMTTTPSTSEKATVNTEKTTVKPENTTVNGAENVITKAGDAVGDAVTGAGKIVGDVVTGAGDTVSEVVSDIVR